MKYTAERRRQSTAHLIIDRTCGKCGRTFRVGPGGLATHVLHCGKREARFWSCVDKAAPNGCWVYKGCRDKWGYAHIGIQGRRHQAHRYSYELAHGPIPAGLLVLHHCDNPACVNPAHLWVGTQHDNMMDCSAKGRVWRGGNKASKSYQREIGRRAAAIRWGKRT